MAEIPVHKKEGGIPWWVWLILALIIAGLLWWLFADNDVNDPVTDPLVTETTPLVEQPVVADAVGPITTMAALMGAPLATMVGREVMLTGVPVESLEGDQSFYIGDSATNRSLVVFNEQPTPNQAQEGNLDVNPGSMVTVRGVIRDGSATPPPGTTTPLPGGAYIEASNVDVVS